MTPEERRAQIAAELDTLLDAVVSIGPHSQRDADAGAPEGAFLAELERQLNEKTAELEALNALCSDPNELRELKYRRSVRESHDFLRVIQIFLIVALFACLFFLSEGLRGSSELLGIAVFGLLYSCVCIAWVTYILCRYKPE